MGTYTTNYQLYIPTVGEQGWGTLVNGNFTTIDTTMGDLNTRLTAVENEVNGNLSCTSVTTSGTIKSTGVINANGGVKGNLTGNVNGNVTGNVTGDITGYLIRMKEETGDSTSGLVYYTIPSRTFADQSMVEFSYTKTPYFIASNNIFKYVISGGNLNGQMTFSVPYSRTIWDGKSTSTSSDTLRCTVELYDKDNNLLITGTAEGTVKQTVSSSSQHTANYTAKAYYTYSYWNKVKYMKVTYVSLTLGNSGMGGGATVTKTITSSSLKSYMKA